MRLKKVIALAVASGCVAPAMAQYSTANGCERSYAFRADVGTNIGQQLCASSSDVFIDAVRNFTLSNLGYTQTSSANVQGRFNDVGVFLNYAANSRTLTYNFPELKMSGQFTGSSRDDSEEQFIDFVKKSDLIGKIMNYQAMHSATSAITGMGGAIPMAGQADFAASFDPMSQIVSGPAGMDTGSNNLIGIGLGYSSFNIDGSADRVRSTTLPLSYTIRNDIDPRRQLVFAMPLALVKVGEADTYHGGLGISYRYPMTDRWTLTPGGKYSIVASKDRATVSTIASASLMSTYVFALGGNQAIAVGNMLGYYKTGKFSSRDFSFDPDIALTMARNGIMYSMPTTMMGGKMAAEFSLIDTRYLGDKPFVDNTQEIGVTVGTNRNAANARSFVRAGLSYVHGKSTKGVTVNIGYWF